MLRISLTRRAVLCVAAAVVVVPACSNTSSAANPPSPTRETHTPSTTPPTEPVTSHPTAKKRRDDWTTYHYSLDRQGYDRKIPAAGGTLAAAWSKALDGAVYAEPLVVGRSIIAVTENDTVYALSLRGKVLWSNHVGEPVPVSELPCGNIDPLGITGTPIYSADTGQVYFAAELDSPIRHELFAVDVKTGKVTWSRSADPAGMVADATQERGALAISAGRVWVPYGGLFGDCGPYHGWIVGGALDGTGDLVVYQQPSEREAGIWAPSGPAVDRAGNLYVAVGNGAALAPPYDDSDSITKLDPQTAGKLDLFAPSSWAEENQSDLDLGSTGPVLFSALGRKWVFADGKAGDAYLLRQGDLGGIGGYAATAGGCSSWSGFAAHAGVVYAPCREGLTAYRIDPGPTITELWRSSDSGYGAAPVLGGGAVWTVDSGELLEIDPVTGATVARQSVGTAPHFATPTLHGHLALVGTQAGISAVTIS
jgi:DNA-binding beta-propeller fold protein YncE